MYLLLFTKRINKIKSDAASTAPTHIVEVELELSLSNRTVAVGEDGFVGANVGEIVGRKVAMYALALVLVCSVSGSIVVTTTGMSCISAATVSTSIIGIAPDRNVKITVHPSTVTTNPSTGSNISAMYAAVYVALYFWKMAVISTNASWSKLAFLCGTILRSV